MLSERVFIMAKKNTENTENTESTKRQMNETRKSHVINAILAGATDSKENGLIEIVVSMAKRNAESDVNNALNMFFKVQGIDRVV